METYFNAHRREASAMANEQVRLLESINDPTLTLSLITAAISVKHETAEMHEVLRLSEYAIDLAAGDVNKGGEVATSSPLALAIAFRGLARWCLGITGWRDDFEQALEMARNAEAVTRGGVMYYTHALAIMHGVLLPSEEILQEMTAILSDAEQTGEDVAFGLGKSNVAFALLAADGDSRTYALELLAQIREITVRQRYSRTAIPMIDAYVAQDRALQGDLDGAIELACAVVGDEIEGGGAIFVPMMTSVLVEAYCSGVPTTTSGARSRRSIDAQRWRSKRAWSSTTSGCCVCEHGYRKYRTPKRRTPTTGTATERWPQSLVSRPIWPGLRLCHDPWTTGSAKWWRDSVWAVPADRTDRPRRYGRGVAGP